jgi:hypothetical protein
VLRTLPLCTCCRHYPGAAAGDSRRSSPQSYQPSPHWQAGRPAHRLFRGLLGVHSRYGLHTRAATVIRGSHSKGFNRFVTSTVAPVASGWSCRRVGLSPTGKRRLFTAHATRSHSRALIRRQKPDIGFCVNLARIEIRGEMQGMATALARRNRFVTWSVVHLFAIAAWMRIASPLWQLSRDERCSDFGDSLYFLVWVLPTLAVGAVAGAWGLAHACFSGNQIGRGRRICFWSLVLVAWLTAAGVAYVKVRQDGAIPCAG